MIVATWQEKIGGGGVMTKEERKWQLTDIITEAAIKVKSLGRILY